MRIRGLSLIALCVILTALPGCDNVYWGGVEMELRPPESRASDLVEEGEEGEDEEPPPEPIRLGPLIYLIERSGPEASVLPVAEWRNESYHPLPAEDDTPDLMERFPLERWDAGTEFVLLHQGTRVGTLVSDGSTARDESTCVVRPRGQGRLELRPEASNATRFLAVRKADVEEGRLPGSALVNEPFPAQISQADLRSTAVSLGRYLIPRAEIPWPPSIPDLLADQRQVGSVGGDPALAATFIFGDEAEVRPAMASAYSFLTLARNEDGEWSPFWLWFQQAGDGKVVPRVLASGSVLEAEAPELILELFGSQTRGLAILGSREGEWSLLHRDDCAPAPASGAARNWP